NTLGQALAAQAVPGQPFVALCPGADGDGLRRLCLTAAEAGGALTAVLAPGGTGLAYALTVPGGDARSVCRALNAAFGGRGGGKPNFCQGSLTGADFDAVQDFLRNLPMDQ
ncbi:MAG: alanyl-tRNA editing protein, partial [Gemmiger sp.]|nr:alanyl-tRNA editing protein [Gemmiger sp.]